MNTTTEQISVVVIDDDHVMRLSCRKILTKAGFQVRTFEDGTKGLEGIAEQTPDLVIVDLKMPGISGMEVITRVHKTDPDVAIVVITGYATIGSAVETVKSGAYEYIPKPFSPDELRVSVNRALDRRQLLLESHRLETERELLKRQFITFVSHQLQTPLVAVYQYLEVMKSLGDTPTDVQKREEWLSRCLHRTDEMLSIIKEWLSLSKIESGSLTSERSPIDLKQIAVNILKSYEQMAAKSDVSLESDLPEESYIVKADRQSLTVLLDNLVVNAIKYNRPGGKVVVSGELQDDVVVMEVRDTGIGIPAESKELVFDEFYRVKGESSKKSTGTGLGLPICKRIVSELGGSIDVESEANVGSTFRVSLPINPDDASPAQSQKPSQ